jgi:ATP-dependent helicase HrpA
LLNRIPRHRFEWLVPGMLRDKCIALIKLLPKPLRKLVVPVPDYVDRVLAAVAADDVPLLEVLSRQLKQPARVDIALDQWQPELLDDFYRMNYRVVDGDGQPLGQGRDLEKLLVNFKGQVSATLQQQTSKRFQSDNITRWDFGELPQDYQFEQAGVTVTSYPALVDCKDSVAIELKDFPEQAHRASRAGMVRLLMLQLPQQIKTLRKELLRGNTLALQLAGIDQQRHEWLDDLLFSVFERVFLGDRELPRTEQDFQQCLQAYKQQLLAEATATAQLLAKIASHYTAIRKQLKKANQLAWAFAIADVQQQLAQLFADSFIVDTPWDMLQQYPRYLIAVEQRLEKLHGHFQRDKTLLTGLTALSEPLYRTWQDNREAASRSVALLEFRWLLEEYRVSLFAQNLGTRQAVSEKRLKELWKSVKQSLLDVRS